MAFKYDDLFNRLHFDWKGNLVMTDKSETYWIFCKDPKDIGTRWVFHTTRSSVVDAEIVANNLSRESGFKVMISRAVAEYTPPDTKPTITRY